MAVRSVTFSTLNVDNRANSINAQSLKIPLDFSYSDTVLTFGSNSKILSPTSTGGSGTKTYSVIGFLPNGISLNSNNGNLSGPSSTQWGGIDTTQTTNIGSGPNLPIWSIQSQSDDKIVIAGTFTLWNGSGVNRLIRLNSDGTVDSTFRTNIGSGASGDIYTMKIQADGKIIMAGWMPNWDGTAVNKIARLNTDGTRDTSFSSNIGSGANLSIYNLGIQSNNKIVVVGAFTSWNGVSVNRVIRLNEDGTRDTSFTTNIGTGPNATDILLALVRPNDKLIIGTGDNLTSWNGTTVKNFVALNNDGTIDTSFMNNVGTGAAGPNNGQAYISAYTGQTDGKLIMGGYLPPVDEHNSFVKWNGTNIRGIVRLNNDGTTDTSFVSNIGTGPNNTIHEIYVQGDGKIIVGGEFTSWNGLSVGRVVRLNADGSVDGTFIKSNGTGANNAIRSWGVGKNGVTQQQGNKNIILTGQFTTWNDNSRNRIVPLKDITTSFPVTIGLVLADASKSLTKYFTLTD